MESVNEFPWATVTVVVLTVIAAAAGAAVVIWGNPGTLSFANYLKYMGEYAAGLGLLGIGRGVRAHGKLTATKHR